MKATQHNAVRLGKDLNGEVRTVETRNQIRTPFRPPLGLEIAQNWRLQLAIAILAIVIGALIT